MPVAADLAMSARIDPQSFLTSDSAARIARLERALDREKRARHDAEAIAEKGLRDLYISRGRLELLNRIATVANESNDPREALRQAVKEICVLTGWAIGTVLIRTGEGAEQRLEGTGITFSHSPDLMFAFADASERLMAWPCSSLTGRLFLNPLPTWTPDIHADPSFSRSEVAARCRLKSAVSAPILSGQELVAAVEFFAIDAVEPDPELLELLTQIGAQVGRVFKRQQHAKRLIESATLDALTKLPNRTLFETRLTEAFSRSRATRQPTLSLIYIDLDGFKLVNDTLGHQAGDQLLVAMANRLCAVCEDFSLKNADDTVMIARIGGDEFTVLVHSPSHQSIASEIAASIHECLHPPHRIGNQEVRAAASIGIAHDDASYDTPDALMRDADIAMYEAKYQGKAAGAPRTVAFDAEMRAEALARLELEAALRDGLERKSFEIHYQPIVDLNSLAVVGFEALLRWPQADGSNISPEIFVPVAEECGLIVPLGSWVFREVCRTAARWRKVTGGKRDFYISVNVAPSQFQQPNFVDLVRDILVETGADPKSLTIELTESAAILNPALTGRMLEELRLMGLKVSLDDFGTGYSSLSHLQSMTFDSLKIDRSFIMKQHEDDSCWTIVNAMMKLAEAMNLRVVAEGIETEFQRLQLEQFGCGFGQGWLFDRALPSAEAVELLMNAAKPSIVGSAPTISLPAPLQPNSAPSRRLTS